MEEIVKHINDTNASYRALNAGDAKNTDLFLDNEHYELFKDAGEQITVRFNKENLQKAILFIASILPRKYDNSSVHKTIPFSPAFVLDQLAFLDAFFTIEGKGVETRTQIWNARKDVEKKNGEIDNRFYFNGLLEDVSYKSIGGEFKTAKFTIRNYVAGGYSDLHVKKTGNGIFDVWVTNVLEPYNDGKEKGCEQIDVSRQSLQQIFYGAPGTGKSHRIKDNASVKAADEKNLVFRTTFHPDSDYSTFVGAYKPTMDKRAVRNVAGDIVKNTDKEEVYEDCIIYSFVPQAFLQAYVAAWNNPDDKVFLVIEEINRGNCAQIFGDLFQLLDRDCDGFSEYPIMADKDLAKYLNSKDENGKDVLTNKDGIKDGKLRLPNNLYIWATMNTSDQSLFPIDSAFKRRWEWVYMPIDTKKENWYIQVGDSRYSWTAFLNKVNDELLTDETAEDKHLGFYFCKAENGIISKETFVAKVLFYLWTDVFKVYGIPSVIGSGREWSFAKFYNPDGSVNEAKVKELMAKLNIEAIPFASNEDGTIDVEVMEASIDANNNKNHLKEVRFPDGVTYDTSVNAFDAYIKTIEKIGVEKVASVADQLKYRRLGKPLISTEKYSELDNNGGYSYHQIGNYYFVRGAKTYTYVRILEDLNDMLGVGMTIVCE